MTKVQCEIDPGRGTPRPDDSVNPASAESPRAAAPIDGDKNDGQKAKRKHICLLVVGPSGSGKSAFIASVACTPEAESDVMVGHGIDPCTVSCSSHDLTEPTSGTRITILDTPGFNDQSRNDLEILGEIAAFVSSNTLPPISAVIFTHAITENRVTGSSRLNLEIAKALCGEAFYPRLALLTTMWNKIPDAEMWKACSKREDEILSSSALWAEMKTKGCIHGRFDGSSTSGWHFLNQLLVLDQPSGVGLAFEQELLSGAKPQQTRAGAIILAEREKRRQQTEAELLEIQNEQREKLQAGLLRLQELRQNGQGLGMGQLTTNQAPRGQHPMMYPFPSTFDREQQQPPVPQLRLADEMLELFDEILVCISNFLGRLFPRSRS